jgi:hypothetical protein
MDHFTPAYNLLDVTASLRVLHFGGGVGGFVVAPAIPVVQPRQDHQRNVEIAPWQESNLCIGN